MATANMGLHAVELMLGMDIAYNIGSFSLSAPQTTERRIKDLEGTSETADEAMKWVWLSTWKMLAYTALPSLLGRTIWPFIGGLIVVADVHGSYWFAIKSGEKSNASGGGKRSFITGALFLGDAGGY